MGVKLISGQWIPPSEVMCNICDRMLPYAQYQGTKSGICESCRLLVGAPQIEFLTIVISKIHQAYNRKNNDITWIELAKVMKGIYTAISQKYSLEAFKAILQSFSLTDEETDLLLKEYEKLRK